MDRDIPEPGIFEARAKRFGIAKEKISATPEEPRWVRMRSCSSIGRCRSILKTLMATLPFGASTRLISDSACCSQIPL